MAKIGDIVRFLNEVGGGRVVKIIDKRTVLVETEDGFEIPTLNSELVVVNTDNYNRIIKDASSKYDAIEPINQMIKPHKKVKTTEESEVDSLKEIETNIVDKKGDDVSLHVAFVPRDLNHLSTSSFDFYIINDSTYRVLYTISKWCDGMLKPLKSAVIGADTKEFVLSFNQSDFAQLTLNVQAIYFKNIAYKAHNPEYFDIDINPVKMQKIGVFFENDYFEEKAYVLAISNTQRDEMMLHLTHKAISESIKQKDTIPLKVVHKKPDEMVEVDLHIHELIDNWNDMTPGEIIQIQLSRFETSLETGLRSNTRRMVFIHGLGNGKLKFELLKILDNKYPKLRYQDASFKEYGYGATLVYLK